MDIGGYDLVLHTETPQELADKIKEFLNWDEAVTEMEQPADPEIPNFFYYKNQTCKDSWDIDASQEFENTMVYFLFDTNELTCCTDEKLYSQIEKYVSENCAEMIVC